MAWSLKQPCLGGASFLFWDLFLLSAFEGGLLALLLEVGELAVDDVVGEAEGYVTILCVLRKPVLASRHVAEAWASTCKTLASKHPTPSRELYVAKYGRSAEKTLRR